MDSINKLFKLNIFKDSIYYKVVFIIWTLIHLLTFGQYIIFSVIINYIIAFITCMISVFISSKTSTYISAIGIQIPILFAFAIWLNNIGMKSLTITFYPKYSLGVIYLLLILVSVGFVIKRSKKEKIADI